MPSIIQEKNYRIKMLLSWRTNIKWLTITMLLLRKDKQSYLDNLMTYYLYHRLTKLFLKVLIIKFPLSYKMHLFVVFCLAKSWSKASNFHPPLNKDICFKESSLAYAVIWLLCPSLYTLFLKNDILTKIWQKINKTCSISNQYKVSD